VQYNEHYCQNSQVTRRTWSPSKGICVNIFILFTWTVQWFSGQISAADAKAAKTSLRYSCVEVIATTILLLSWRSGWLLRNIHISNDNGSFTFYVDVFFPLSLSRLTGFFLVFCVVLLCVFMFLVVCYDVRYDFRIKTMFDSSLSPVACRRDHVLFTLFVFICA
jgi:hypothetical protein